MNRLVSAVRPLSYWRGLFVPVANLLPQPWAECIIAIKLMTLFRLPFLLVELKVKFQGGIRDGGLTDGSDPYIVTFGATEPE